jgi:hypothetical protein
MGIFLLLGPSLMVMALQQKMRYYEFLILIPLGLYILLSLYAIILPFMQMRGLIKSESIQHMVMTPMGWEGVVSGKIWAHAMRSFFLSGCAIIGFLFFIVFDVEIPLDVTWGCMVFLTPLPFFTYFMIVMSVYYAIRFYHTWFWAIIWQIFFGIGITLLAAYLLFSFVLSAEPIFEALVNFLNFTDEELMLTIIPVISVLIFAGWGRFYRVKMREFLRGNALERLMSSKAKVRAFGSLPWYRVDLFRQLWPLKTWARLRFVLNCYLLTFLVLTLPISFTADVQTTFTAILLFIWMLPYVLCYFALPGHWRGVMKRVPQAWQAEIPDANQALPAWVTLRVLVIPWLMIFTLTSTIWLFLCHGIHYYFSYIWRSSAYSYYSYYNPSLYEQILHGFTRTIVFQYGFIAGILLGWMFVLLYLHHIARKEERNQSPYSFGWHWIFGILFVFVTWSLTAIINGSFMKAFWDRSNRWFFPFPEENGLLTAFCLVIFAFFPLWGYLTTCAMKPLKKMLKQ